MLLIILAIASVFDLGARGFSFHDELDQEIGPVVYANIVYRHGFRTPVRQLSGLRVSYRNFYPQGEGELTQSGMRAQYELGRWFRRRYNHLIPSVGLFNPILVNVTSSSADRTIASALCNLAGMFPPNRESRWGPIDWTPIPLMTVPADRDNFFELPNRSCKKWTRAFAKFKNSEEYKQLAGQYSWVFEESMRNFNSVFNQTDPLEFCNLLFGNFAFSPLDPIPMSAAERGFIESLDKCNMAYFHSFTFTNLMRRLVGGPLLKQIIQNMEIALQNESQLNSSSPLFQRFAIFSGKDLTVAPLLFTLGVNETQSPKPASVVLTELRLSSNDTAYVTVLFKNSYGNESEPELVDIPQCANPCPLDQFVKVMEPFTPDNWEIECNN